MAVATKSAAGMERAELKKALVIARRHPMHVAFALGADGKAVIMVDKTRKGPALDKEIKAQAPDAKNHRFGTVLIDENDPKLARFVVNKAGGGLARKLLIALKGTGFSKVELVLDDGSSVESEQGEDEDETGGEATVADSPDTTTDSDTDTTTDSETDTTGPGDGQAADGQADAQPDAGALASDLKDLVTQMLRVIAADPTKKAALAELATDAQASLKRGDLAQAAAGIEILREALGSSDAAASPPASAASPDTGTPTTDDDSAQDIPTDNEDARDQDAPDPAALTAALTDLVKQMLKLIAADPSRQDALRGVAQQAQAGLKAGDLETAADQIETLRGMIEGADTPAPATAAGAPPPQAADPAAAQVIAKARTAWVATRQKVEGDLGKLHTAFGSAFKGHSMEDQITKAFRERVDTVLNTLDEALAQKLDDVSSATDPAQRAKLVQEAHGLLQKYQQHIATDPTIAALDSNPFVPLAVQKTMTATLAALSKSIR